MMSQTKQLSENSPLYQEINNLIYKIRMGFLYNLKVPVDVENLLPLRSDDLGKLINIAPYGKSKEILSLFRDNKLEDIIIEDLITPYCLLNEELCDIGIKLNIWSSINKKEKISQFDIRKPSQLEKSLYGIEVERARRNEAFGYINGFKVKGAIFELIEYAKLISKYLEIEIDHSNNQLLDNLVFNYLRTFNSWQVKYFAKKFLSETISLKNNEPIQYTIQKKRFDFCLFFTTPSEEDRSSQELYFKEIDNLF